MAIYPLANTELIPYLFFIRDRMIDPLCLGDSFGNLARILLILNAEKIQEQIGGHTVPKYKKDEFKGDVPLP